MQALIRHEVVRLRCAGTTSGAASPNVAGPLATLVGGYESDGADTPPHKANVQLADGETIFAKPSDAGALSLLPAGPVTDKLHDDVTTMSRRGAQRFSTGLATPRLVQRRAV